MAIIMGILCQYAIFAIYQKLIEIFGIQKILKLELLKIQQLNNQSLEVTCPCSPQAKQLVQIKLGYPNYYKCNTCGKTVGIYITTETAIVTEPVLSTDINTINNLLTAKINEIKHT